MKSVGLLFATFSIAVSMIAVGCSRTHSEISPEPSNLNGKPVDAATAGSIRGIVRLEGTPPKMKSINMAAVPNCAKQHSTPATTGTVVPGSNGTLENVVVYLKGDFSQYSFDAPESPVMIDQNGCVYEPHVVALMTGQQLEVTNSDRATHNINAAPKTNRRWNESQTSGAAPISQTFVRAEIGIPLKCNVHP
jgi:plastocyanin